MICRDLLPAKLLRYEYDPYIIKFTIAFDTFGGSFKNFFVFSSPYDLNSIAELRIKNKGIDICLFQFLFGDIWSGSFINQDEKHLSERL